MQKQSKRFSRSVIGLIPARYDSTRYPGKPLINLNGKTMIRRVYEQCTKTDFLDEIYVVTDHDSIRYECESNSIPVKMITDHCKTGTDRISKVVKKNDLSERALYVNIQGDEPLIDPDTIDAVIDAYDSRYGVSNAWTPIVNPEEENDPNIVKCVVGSDNLAKHFSRHPIDSKRQLGLYAFSPHMLFMFPKLDRRNLERRENVEMLRFLEHGFKIRMAKVFETNPSVDTPEDAEKVRKILDSTELHK